jgi:hypothetical protein
MKAVWIAIGVYVYWFAEWSRGDRCDLLLLALLPALLIELYSECPASKWVYGTAHVPSARTPELLLCFGSIWRWRI